MSPMDELNFALHNSRCSLETSELDYFHCRLLNILLMRRLRQWMYKTHNIHLNLWSDVRTHARRRPKTISKWCDLKFKVLPRMLLTFSPIRGYHYLKLTAFIRAAKTNIEEWSWKTYHAPILLWKRAATSK